MMPGSKRWAAVALVVGLSGCGNGGDGAPPTGDSSGAQPVVSAPLADTLAEAVSPLRGALPGLFSIMLGLQGEMEQVARGIWLQDYDLIAESAQNVADHPTVPPEELVQVSAVLGDDLRRFRAADMKVHDLAVALGELARAEDMTGIVAADADLRAACVECHGTFRARLRRGIAVPAQPAVVE